MLALGMVVADITESDRCIFDVQGSNCGQWLHLILGGQEIIGGRHRKSSNRICSTTFQNEATSTDTTLIFSLVSLELKASGNSSTEHVSSCPEDHKSNAITYLRYMFYELFIPQTKQPKIERLRSHRQTTTSRSPSNYLRTF